MILLLVFAILVSIVAALFALENTTAVTVSFLSYKFDGSLAVVIMIVFGIGILVAVAALLPALLTAKWQVLSLKRRLRLEGPASTDGAGRKETEGEDFEKPPDPPLPPHLPL